MERIVLPIPVLWTVPRKNLGASVTHHRVMGSTLMGPVSICAAAWCISWNFHTDYTQRIATAKPQWDQGIGNHGNIFLSQKQTGGRPPCATCRHSLPLPQPGHQGEALDPVWSSRLWIITFRGNATPSNSVMPFPSVELGSTKRTSVLSYHPLY